MSNNILEIQIRIAKDQLASDAAAAKRMISQGLAGAKVNIDTGATKAKLEDLKADFADAKDELEATGNGAGSLLSKIGGIAEGFNIAIQAVQTFAAQGAQAYDLLIGANERLNAQLLTSQTNLASSSRLFQGGVEITDPTEKILASQPALRAALKQIEQDTQSLVGVTSSQVNELFQTTLQNAAAINNQSKQFPDAIAAATSLTKGWAASLNVIGVPLDQAGQEINSILKGQIDVNSSVAKSLGITNDQVAAWKSQGVLVDELNKRLETFVAGNALAARSVSGVTSNIQDLFERLGRTVGEPFLEPLVEGLSQVEQFLKANEAAISSFFTGFSEDVVNTGGALFKELQPALNEVINLVTVGAPLVENLFQLLENGAIAVAGPLGDDVALLLKIVATATEGLAAISELLLLRQINDAADAIDALSGSTDALTAEAIKNGTALKALNKLRADGTPLTTEQQKQYEALTTSSKGTIAAIDAQIAAYKEINNVSPEVRGQLDAQVSSLEALKASLAGASGSLQIQAKQLDILGTSYAQLAKQAKDAQNSLANDANGDPTQYQEAAKALVDVTQQQLELGQITQAEAERRLASIQDNTKVEVDTQRAAAAAITGIRSAATDAQVSKIQAAQAEVQALQAQGNLTEIEADKQLTALKLQEIQIRIDANKAAQGATAAGPAREKLITEERSLQAELTQARAEFDERENSRAVKAASETAAARIAALNQASTTETALIRQKQLQGILGEEQAATQIAQIQADAAAATIAAKQAEIEGIRKLRDSGDLDPAEAAKQEAAITAELGQLKLRQLETRLATEKQLQDKANAEAIKAVETANAAAEAAIKASQQNRTAAIKQAQLDGVLSEQDAATQIAQIQADATAATIAQKQAELSAVAALKAEGNITDEQAAQDIAALNAEIGQLNIQRIDQELQAQSALKAAVIAGLEEQRAAAVGLIDAQIEGLALQARAIALQNQLLTAQNGLAEAISGLAAEQLNTQLAIAEANGDIVGAEAIKLKALELQSAELIRQQQAERAQLAIKQEITRNELEQQQLKAESAVIDAEIAIQTAIQKGESDKIVESLQRKLALQERSLELTNQALVQSQQANAIEQQTLAVTQASARERQRQNEIRTRDSIADARTERATPAPTAQPNQPNQPNQQRANPFSTRITGNTITPEQARSGNITTGLTAISTSRSAPPTGVNNQISSQLTQLTAAISQADKRPNLTISNVDDLGMAGRIYTDLSRNQARANDL